MNYLTFIFDELSSDSEASLAVEYEEDVDSKAAYASSSDGSEEDHDSTNDVNSGSRVEHDVIP
jgi:hypothetical protein